MNEFKTNSESSSQAAGVSITSENQIKLERLGFGYILPVLQEDQA